MEENTIIDIDTNPNRGYFDIQKKRSVAIKSIIYYLLAMYAFNLAIQVVLIAIAPSITGVSLYEKNVFGETVIAPENESFISAWTQILVYVFMFVSLFLLNKNSLLEDFKEFKFNLKKRLLQIPIGLAIFYAAAFAGVFLLLLLNIEDSSANQDALEIMVNGKYGPIVLFTIVLLGPICEELVFRRSAFNLFKITTNKWVKIIVTGAIFGLIHITSAILMYIIANESILIIVKEILLGIPYVLQGIALSYVYYSSDENILPVTIIHILNNAIAAILIFI